MMTTMRTVTFCIRDEHSPEHACNFTATIATRPSSGYNCYDVTYVAEYSPNEQVACHLHPLHHDEDIDAKGVITPINSCTTALIDLLCAPEDAVLFAGGRRLRPLLDLPDSEVNRLRRERAAASYRGTVMRALAQFWD